MEVTMSRLLVTNKSFELLEPYEGKLSRTVLRGESSRKGADLLDIDQYLNEAHSFGLQSVRAHFNVLAWSDDVQELRHIRNDVGSQLALMECRPRHNTGAYGGCIGFIGLNGSLNQAITIRTFVSRNGVLWFQAGGGIVAQSNDEYELQEVNNKLGALKKAIIMAEKM
jgi:hypothetical protein